MATGGRDEVGVGVGGRGGSGVGSGVMGVMG